MAIKYDNCKNCHSLCIHAGKDRDFVCINGVSCKITTGKSQTNADRVRSMSDEELCNWLFQRDCTNIAAFLEHGGMGVMDAVQLLDWLQKPAEGECLYPA